LARPKPDNVDKLRALEKDPGADVQIERPVSERVNTAFGRNMMKGAQGKGSVRVCLGAKVKEVRDDSVAFTDGNGREESLPNDVVFAMIGREAPLNFFRRSGIPIRGEWRIPTWAGFIAFFLFCCFLYNWKAGTALNDYFSKHHLFPFNLPQTLGDGAFAKTLAVTLRQP